jgi:hypothetical protein
MTILGLQKRKFMTEEMDLQYYFTTQNKKQSFYRQFRLPTYLKNKTGMMIEVCGHVRPRQCRTMRDKRNRRRN